jgi:hypothetical protein
VIIWSRWELRMTSIGVKMFDVNCDGHRPECFTTINHHESWSHKRISRWKMPRERKWQGAKKSQKLALQYDSNKNFSQNLFLLNQSILSKINTLGIRNYHLDFEVEYDNSIDYQEIEMIHPNPNGSGFVKSTTTQHNSRKDRLFNNCKTIWDGMVCFPYKNKHISYVLAKYICIELSTWGNCKNANIEFGTNLGGAGKSYCSFRKFRQCYRDDWKDIIKPQYYNSNLLFLTNHPELIFDFNKFKPLFIKEILPWQIFLKDSSTIYFSPASLGE